MVEMMSTRRLASTWHGLIATEKVGGEGRQLIVAEVQAGSGAETAGFQVGDRIIKVGAMPATTAVDIERASWKPSQAIPSTSWFGAAVRKRSRA